MYNLTGKHVIVNGAAGGVGSVASDAFARAGAKLSLLDHDTDRARALADTLAAAGHPRPFHAAADATDPATFGTVLAAAVAAQGPLHALVHTVGGFAVPGPAHEGHHDVWARMIALNATSVYVAAGAAAQQMLDQGTPGSIVVVLAKAAAVGAANMAAYTASKGAAQRIVESMAAELKAHGIRVNGISPSIVNTAANRADMGEAKAAQWVQPSEIAEAMLFLCSDAASGITGANLLLNGRV